MLNGPLMVQVNLPVVDTIHLRGNMFVKGMKIKATDESKLNDSPGAVHNSFKKLVSDSLN